jgi:transcriptional regulator with XRE-family HTH domain
MPRPNPLRAIQGERALARRVAYERERRGWSTQHLAKRVTAAGCPIHQSAIRRIESGEPPRRITYDEALAFAHVFDTPLEELAVAPEAAADEELRALVAELTKAARRREDDDRRLVEVIKRLAVIAAGRSELRELLRELLHDWLGEMVDDEVTHLQRMGENGTGR